PKTKAVQPGRASGSDTRNPPGWIQFSSDIGLVAVVDDVVAGRQRNIAVVRRLHACRTNVTRSHLAHHRSPTAHRRRPLDAHAVHDLALVFRLARCDLDFNSVPIIRVIGVGDLSDFASIGYVAGEWPVELLEVKNRFLLPVVEFAD